MLLETRAATGFFEAWNGLRHENNIPHYRTLFNKLEPHLISNFLIIEQINAHDYVLRFVGTGLTDQWGEETTGTDPLVTLPAALADAFRTNISKALAQPCGMRALNVSVNKNGLEFRTERVVLPVGVDDGRPARILSFDSAAADLSVNLSAEAPITTALEHAWLDIGLGVPEGEPVI